MFARTLHQSAGESWWRRRIIAKPGAQCDVVGEEQRTLLAARLHAPGGKSCEPALGKQQVAPSGGIRAVEEVLTRSDRRPHEIKAATRGYQRARVRDPGTRDDVDVGVRR